MLMPKTAMYKYYVIIFWQADVRFAGEVSFVNSEPETERMETVNKAMAIQKALELLNIS